jgi:hypothetical protein
MVVDKVEELLVEPRSCTRSMMAMPSSMRARAGEMPGVPSGAHWHR